MRSIWTHARSGWAFAIQADPASRTACPARRGGLATVTCGSGGRLAGRAPAAARASSRQATIAARASCPSVKVRLYAEGFFAGPIGLSAPKRAVTGLCSRSAIRSQASWARSGPQAPRNATVTWRSSGWKRRMPRGVSATSAENQRPAEMGSAINQLGFMGMTITACSDG